MIDFTNKKILMFYPYGATKHYGDSIKEELLRRGSFVINYDERPSQNALVKVIIRLYKTKIPSIFLSYINRIIRKNGNIEFDYVVIFRGEAFTEDSVNLLKKTYPKATFILYLWDILKTNNKLNIIDLFDKSYTFDPEDAKNHTHLNFRPTFFIQSYQQIVKNKDELIDISFVGTLHSDRYYKLSNIKLYLSDNDISYYFYYYVPSILVLIKDKISKHKYAKMSEVSFKPLSLKDIQNVISNSKCILDLNFPGQSSLSMRAYEAIASKTKYITTNKNILKYDFYIPNNILIIDENNLNIPIEFIDTPFEEIPNTILSKYSVRQFVDDIFY